MAIFDASDTKRWVKVPQSILCDKSLKSALVLVYCCIKAHIKAPNGLCIVKMATLESECGLEVRQVRRHIDRLEAHCLIKVKRSRKRDADGQVRNSLNEISLLPLEIRYKTPWEPFNGDLTENEQSQVRPYKSCDSREKKEDAFGKLPYTILYGTTLKDISKRLYPYLMARLGNHEYCKTNYKEIADHLGVTDSTVKLGLAELKAQGQIHVKRINHGIEINKS